MIKQSKLPDNQILYSDARTNDPIAIAKVTDAARYAKNKKNYELTWHPTMQKMYPATSSLSRMNLGTERSASDASNTVEFGYSQLMKNPDVGDPLKTSLVSGHTERMQETGGPEPVKYEYSQYHIHDPETDKPVASLLINNKLKQFVGLDNGHFNGYQKAYPHSVLEYHGEKPTDEQQKVLEVKHPGVDPISQIQRVKTWLETRHKEPTFVGEHTSDGVKHYKHKQTPEDAVNKYVDHLKTKHDTAGLSFDKVAPGLAVAIKPSESEYDVGKYHVIDARQPGKLVHLVSDIRNSKHYKTQPLNEIID